MNNRFTLQDMAGLLATQTGRTKKDSEEFLRTLINVISEGVFDDRLVKVKGLGTFKIIEVEDRESINVNTGKRIIIPGHYKFNFLPDKDLKELVNKPFSFFDTTEINNEEKLQQLAATTEENIETGQEEEEREEDMNTQSSVSPLESTAAELSQIRITESSISIEEKNDCDIQTPTPEETEIIVEEETETEEVNPDVEIMEDIVEEENTNEEIPEQQEENKQEKEKELQPLVEKMTSGLDHDVKTPSNKGNKTLLIIILILLVGAVAVFAFLFFSPAKQSGLTPQIITSEPIENTIKSETSLDETSTDAQNVVNESVGQVSAEERPPTASSQKILDTITIEPGSRLTLLALDYYGHKIFWVYIYEYNKNVIEDPNNIPVGTKLLIPAPEVYEINVKDRASIERASVLQTQIISGEN